MNLSQLPHTCNPGIGETEAGGCESEPGVHVRTCSRSVWAAKQGDRSSVSSSHVGQLTTACHSSSGRPDTSSGVCALRTLPTQTTDLYTYKLKQSFSFLLQQGVIRWPSRERGLQPSPMPWFLLLDSRWKKQRTECHRLNVAYRLRLWLPHRSAHWNHYHLLRNNDCFLC